MFPKPPPSLIFLYSFGGCHPRQMPKGLWKTPATPQQVGQSPVQMCAPHPETRGDTKACRPPYPEPEQLESTPSCQGLATVAEAVTING
jgi:hypothetical protein